MASYICTHRAFRCGRWGRIGSGPSQAKSNSSPKGIYANAFSIAADFRLTAHCAPALPNPMYRDPKCPVFLLFLIAGLPKQQPGQFKCPQRMHLPPDTALSPPSTRIHNLSLAVRIAQAHVEGRGRRVLSDRRSRKPADTRLQASMGCLEVLPGGNTSKGCSLCGQRIGTPWTSKTRR